MHAVVVSVTINDFEEALPDLRERVVPQVKQAPGFAAGYWVALGGHGRGRLLSRSSRRTPRAKRRA